MGDNPTYNSISTNKISTATITASTIYARTSVSTTTVYADYLKGDGSGLTNLSYGSFTTSIPRTSYGAFSIPWNAMEDEGSINLRSATWTINGMVAATNMSASHITSQSFSTTNGRIANLVSPVICSFYISTNTVQTEIIYFDRQYGRLIKVDSTISKSISTDKLTTNTLDIVKFTALQGVFSSISTGFWEAETIKSDRLQLLDLSSLKYGYITMSANVLYLNNSSILSNVPKVEDLVSTTARLKLDLYNESIFLNPHAALSSLSAITTTQWSISQVAFSTLSTGIGDLRFDTKTAATNLRDTLTTKITELSNYTDTADATISARISDYQIEVGNKFVTLSNYVDTADNFLKQGISSTAFYISLNTSTNIINTSTSIGESIKDLRTGLSSVGLITTRSISTVFSTLSTQVGWNFSTSFGSLSTSISNLSTFYTPTFADLRTGHSTNASNISVMWGSVFSSLSSTGLFQSVSSFSTAIGEHVVLMSNSLVGDTNSLIGYINDNRDFLSTVAGSNFSTLKLSVSSLSTASGLNFDATKLALSSLSTTIGSNSSTINQSLLSTISTFSTAITLNFINLSTVIDFNLLTVSTNLKNLSNVSLSAFSSLSTTIGQTSNYLSYFSTISTSIGSTNSTLYSILALGISSISIAIESLNSTSYNCFSTQALFTSSISSANLTSKFIFASTLVTSSFSTGVGFFNRFEGSTISSLTQQIGRLLTTQIIASSFSGNLNDTTTVVIQYI